MAQGEWCTRADRIIVLCKIVYSVAPPSTAIAAPVMNAPAAEASSNSIEATSSGVPAAAGARARVLRSTSRSMRSISHFGVILAQAAKSDKRRMP
jgi:hypothetical protein